jgi:ribosome-associated protein
LRRAPRPDISPAVPQPLDPREVALACAEVADEKKAEDIVILEVRDFLVITSYFVLATGETRKQLQAIADAIHQRLRPLGVRRFGTEGFEEGKWILLDYGDVIVQLFDRETRKYYNLEMIWGDAPRLAWHPKRRLPAAAPPRRAKADRYAEEE